MKQLSDIDRVLSLEEQAKSAIVSVAIVSCRVNHRMRINSVKRLLGSQKALDEKRLQQRLQAVGINAHWLAVTKESIMYYPLPALLRLNNGECAILTNSGPDQSMIMRFDQTHSQSIATDELIRVIQKRILVISDEDEFSLRRKAKVQNLSKELSSAV